ncbi:MAG: DUF5050 domain-containing protein [Lachnospiraceae bacterium]|nr:DUF5050 domain-containing protein [Lachnospiraceae bacterium]
MAKQKLSAKEKSRNAVIIIAAVVLAVVGLLAALFGRQPEKVPANPPGTVGNTPGNLYNGGVLCQNDTLVFFSNPYDGGALYRMNADESDCHKISTSVPSNLLSAGNYLYFFQTGSAGGTGLGGVVNTHTFNRMHTDGSKAMTLLEDKVVIGQLVGDWLYLEGTGRDKGIYFFKVSTNGASKDGKGRVDLGKFAIEPVSVVGNTIYYSSSSDHGLYTLNTASDASRLLIDGNFWNPIVEGDYVYYMDLDNDYQLRRYSLSQGTVEILTTERVESYNVGYGYIYYQTMGDDPHLVCMYTDGSNKQIVAGGVYNSVSLSSRFVYFRDYFQENVLYHCQIGASYYEPCTAAKEAADRAAEEERKK